MKHSKYFNLVGILLISIIVFSCSSNMAKDHNRVIVVHARGITYPDMMQFLNLSDSVSFFKENASKKHIKKLQPIANAVTICNIASFETGVAPSEHGIIGHSFAKKVNDTLRVVSGFSQRFEKETFWEKADKQGYKVLKIGDLTLHGKYTTHTNVDCLAQGSQTSNAMLLTLTPSNKAQTDKIIKYENLEGHSQFALQPEFADSIKFYRTKDIVDSNVVYLDWDYDITNGFLVKVEKNRWTEITNKSTAEALQAFRIKWSISNDTINVYVRASYANRGYPNTFVKKINEAVGPSKGWPNIGLFTSGKIDYTTLWEEISCETDYVIDAFSYATQNQDYRLIMIDYPLMDRLGHAFLNQKESSKEIQQIYFDSFKRMDKDFQLISSYAQQNGYELIITSGHGFSPIHSSIDINQFFNKNHIKTDVKKPGWEAIGILGKVSTHIYINEQLSKKDRAVISNKIDVLLEDLLDKNSGQKVIDKKYKKEDLEDIEMWHENSGDLFVLLKPGYVFNNNREGKIFSTPIFNGDHGYSLNYKDSYGILIANSECDSCKSIEIADMITRILKLDQ